MRFCIARCYATAFRSLSWRLQTTTNKHRIPDTRYVRPKRCTAGKLHEVGKGAELFREPRPPRRGTPGLLSPTPPSHSPSWAQVCGGGEVGCPSSIERLCAALRNCGGTLRPNVIVLSSHKCWSYAVSLSLSRSLIQISFKPCPLLGRFAIIAYRAPTKQLW